MDEKIDFALKQALEEPLTTFYKIRAVPLLRTTSDNQLFYFFLCFHMVF
jgi:hypothetical protein